MSQVHSVLSVSLQYVTTEKPISNPEQQQHSTAQHSTAQHSMARHGTAQHGTARHSTAQHGRARHSTAQHGTAQHSMAEHGTEQHTAHLNTASHPKAHQKGWRGGARLRDRHICTGLLHHGCHQRINQQWWNRRHSQAKISHASPSHGILKGHGAHPSSSPPQCPPKECRPHVSVRASECLLQQLWACVGVRTSQCLSQEVCTHVGVCASKRLSQEVWRCDGGGLPQCLLQHVWGHVCGCMCEALSR